ncbi:MAG: hypothetical protein HOP30_02955 [Cyclobacteriaceae bacterium]|nr:hypothetical protein [Cyclobacteriaceae bacterium]
MPRLLLLTTILIFTTTVAQAQVISRDSLMGAWVCKKTVPGEGLSPTAPQWKLDKMNSMLIGSTMVFKKNGLFEWKFLSTAPPEAKEMQFLNGKEWIIDTVNDVIHIGKPSENLLMFSIAQEAGATYFILDDFPLKMQVEKQSLR